MVTLDVKNAFNSARWSKILGALEAKGVPSYLVGVIRSYLRDRRLRYGDSSGHEETISLTCGVPQGSVLGPDLWNVLYDGLLRTAMPQGVELLAFADDVAVVATGKGPWQLEELLAEAVFRAASWLTDHGLKLAAEKTEVVVLTRRNRRNTMVLSIGPHRIPSATHLRYLGVLVDARLNFIHHAASVAARADLSAQRLSRLLPNVRGPRQGVRRLLATVPVSQMLYGAPFWVESISIGAMKRLEAVHRRVALRVASCYRTVSYGAAGVVSSLPPLRLLAEERASIWRGTERAEARAQLCRKWQAAWDSDIKGCWTYSMIPDITRWTYRRHGEVDFHLTQLLTGHGSFGSYLF